MNDNYDEALPREGRNIGKLIREGRLDLPRFRDAEIDNIVGALVQGRSILLLGETGVGKTAVIHGVAEKLARRRRSLWELNSMAVLSGTRYLGDWQTKTEKILDALEKKRSILYFTDIWNLPTVGSTSNDRSSLLDYLRPRIESGKLQLVGEISPDKMQDMQKVPQFASLFSTVRLEPLAAERIETLLIEHARNKKIAIANEAIVHLLTLCRRFLPADRGPGQALRMLQQIDHYHSEKIGVDEPEGIDIDFVDKVFCIYSGLPRFVISRSAFIAADEIRRWFAERVIGQDRAIEAVVEVITLFKAGLHDPNRPMGTFLFVGPTGVGKTELAKSLAQFLFGSETRLLRFDLSEFKDYHAFQMLVGDPDKADAPARLLDPVRVQPFQVILLDEIEKAHANIWDILLQLLDDGHVTSAQGSKVNFRNTIVIATSNVGARESLKKPIGFSSQASGDVPIKALEAVFRPELLNRFQHIVTFNSLSREQVVAIVHKEIKLVLNREGIASRNLAIDLAPEVIDLVIDRGYDPAYGARALKRQVQQCIVVPIASCLMEQEIYAGSILKLDCLEGEARVRILDTDHSRAQRDATHEREQARARARNLSELKRSAQSRYQEILDLSREVDTGQQRQQIEELELQRSDPEFWRDALAASQVILQIEESKARLNRLQYLQQCWQELDGELNSDAAAAKLEYLDRQVDKLADLLARSRRELLTMRADGKWDALIAITPIRNPAQATVSLRDLLYETYRLWAQWHGGQCVVLHDAITAEEPICIAIKGHYAHGYLRGESGVHRAREGKLHSTVRIGVAPWSQAAGDVVIRKQHALKKRGCFGDKIRSRMEIAGSPDLVLQNANTLIENRELARELFASWQQLQSSDKVTRRYDFAPFYVKDYLTGRTGGRRAMLRPIEFHRLLCERVDLLAESDD